VKIITRGVIDWRTLRVEECESYEHEGPVAECKSSGSAPQPVDPYAQAAAQYGLSTGTAAFNAALNRPTVVNPLGSSSWGVSGYSGGLPGGAGRVGPTPSSPLGGFALGGPGGYGLGGGFPTTASPYGVGGTALGAGAPLYTQTTQLAPQFNSLLQRGINTAGIPQLSGENLTPLTQQTQNAVFGQTMGYIQPEQQLASEQLNSQLAAEGLMPGSDAWNNEQARLGRQQTFQTNQAAAGAVTAGEQELANLYGLGGQSLQAQIAQQQAPINEFNALTGSPAATAMAQTPDIGNAFAQQYQGALAGYNANVASQNAAMGDASSLLGSYLMYLALTPSDRRLKTDIKREDTLPSGPGVYSYRFKGSPSRELGVIAQDVERTHPHAVFNLGGTKFVNYGAL
jgi:endosialidase-like protein